MYKKRNSMLTKGLDESFGNIYGCKGDDGKKYITLAVRPVFILMRKNEFNKNMSALLIPIINYVINIVIMNDCNVEREHKKIVQYMRMLYKSYPAIFGYAVCNPHDKWDIDEAVKHATIRLVNKEK